MKTTMKTTQVNRAQRRDFIKLTLMSGAGLTLGMHIAPNARAGHREGAVDSRFEANAFVKVGVDDSVTVVVKHIEFGQGTFTGLATLVAEEMDAAWSQIRAEHAPADAGRYNNLLWGAAQGTGGSTAIANSYQQLREAGAAAKHMLVAAAASAWGVPAGEIRVNEGVVSHVASKQKASFGQLAADAARQPIPQKVQLKNPRDFKLIGREVLPRKDVGKTDGSAVYTQDINLPGQLTALVAHPPLFGAQVKNVDSAAAMKISGVEHIVEIPSGVAVLAKDYWTAKKGRDALIIDWDESSAYKGSSQSIMQAYRKMASQPGVVTRSEGDAPEALKGAAQVIEAEYEFPFLAHASMEPLNCVVDLHDEGCDVWNGCQMQTADQYAIAGTLGLKPEQVAINTVYAGGSFGRRANPVADYVLEAVNIAKALDLAGKRTPVKLVWTREDDTRAGYYRPMYFHRIMAGLDEKGKPIAWQHHIVGQSILKGTPFEPMLVKNGIDTTSVEGAQNLPYAIPNLQIDLHTSEDVQVPVLWWRSVGSTHTAYSTETMIDEMAVAANVDPVEYRMALLESHPRHQGVLKLAAEKSGWGTPLPQGKGRGVAVHESFNSFVAQVAEVSLNDEGGYSVDRIVCAVDCGVAVNPDVIRAQMEGGIGFGLSPVLMSEITLEDGRVKESNYHDYRVLRMNQMPKIEVHIVPSDAPPTGVGEPGTPVVAPAVANALAAVTGKRYYQQPIKI